jgi:uncharacterized iron-regulated membrane protein
MGISGTILVFRPQIESASMPKLPATPTCAAFNPDAAVLVVATIARGAEIDRIVFPSEKRHPYLFQLTRPKGIRVAYDGCSNRVLGIVNLGWVDWIADLHHNLLAGKSGRRTVGVIGIALFLSSASGLFVWFISSVRRWVKIDTRASTRRMVYDLHRSVGLLAWLVLFFQAATGIALAYPQWLQSVTTWFAPTASAKNAQKIPGKHSRVKAPVASLADAMQLAQRAMPDGEIREIRLPGSGGKQLMVRFWRAGEMHAGGSNTVYLNASGSAVLSVVQLSDQPAGRRFTELLTPIHYGEWGGLAARIVLALGGSALPVLFLSGVLIRWWPKRKTRASVPQASKSRVAISIDQT